MIQLAFGPPEYGWLPVHFQAQGFHLELDVSDGPVNPLENLCSALISVLQGKPGEMGWNLEPVWYWFRFEPEIDEQITLRICRAEKFSAEADEILQITGAFSTMLLPFYKVLEQNALVADEDNWPIIDSDRMDKLTELISARKWNKNS